MHSFFKKANNKLVSVAKIVKNYDNSVLSHLTCFSNSMIMALSFGPCFCLSCVSLWFA